MNRAELYTKTRPEQRLINLDVPDMVNIDNAELLSSVGKSPTMRMRLGAAAKTSVLNLGWAMSRVRRLRHTLPVVVGSGSGYLGDIFSKPPSTDHILDSRAASGIIVGGLVFALATLAPYVIDEFRERDEGDVEVHIKHGSLKKAWEEARTQFPETVLYISPQNTPTESPF